MRQSVLGSHSGEGSMRGRVLGFVVIAMLGVSAHPFGQWLKHPTDGRAAKGRRHVRIWRRPRRGCPTASRTSPASGTPRIPTRCAPGGGAFVECGVEIGGSPLGGNLGRNLPGGLPYQPHAAATGEGAPGRRQPRRSARALPARQSAAVVDAAAPHQGHPHAEAAGAALRSERDVPADPHRRTAAARRPDARLERLLDRALGRRHAGGADRRLPRRPVDRHRAAAR